MRNSLKLVILNYKLKSLRATKTVSYALWDTSVPSKRAIGFLFLAQPAITVPRAQGTPSCARLAASAKVLVLISLILKTVLLGSIVQRERLSHNLVMGPRISAQGLASTVSQAPGRESGSA